MKQVEQKDVGQRNGMKPRNAARHTHGDIPEEQFHFTPVVAFDFGHQDSKTHTLVSVIVPFQFFLPNFHRHMPLTFLHTTFSICQFEDDYHPSTLETS